MKRAKSGFTLIELMMVVLVISLLVVMLVPVIGAVKKAVRISMTENRIWEIDAAIGLYKDTFGDYPPSGKPAGADWSSYPEGWFERDDAKMHLFGYPEGFHPNGSRATHPENRFIPSPGPGATYLAYFLFGPMRFGWSPENHDGISVNWTPPNGLERYLSDKAVTNENHNYDLNGNSVYHCNTQPYLVLEDAFGLTGSRFCGAILYLRADVRNRSPMVGGNNARWNYSHVSSQYDWMGGGWYGQGAPHLSRLLAGTNKPFALISAGADGDFGYFNSSEANRRFPDAANGASDDITNFVHD